jgi:splicing factor 3B subunit 1
MADGNSLQVALRKDASKGSDQRTAEFQEIRRLQQERNASKSKTSKTFDPSTQRVDDSKVSLTDTFDTTLYDRSGVDKFAGYNDSIPVDGEDEDTDMPDGDGTRRLVGQYTATKEMMNEFARGADDIDQMEDRAKVAQIAERETDYQKRRFARKLSPTRKDGFANGEGEGRSYKEVMQERELEREEERVRRKIEEKLKSGDQMEGVQHEATLKLEEKVDGTAEGTRKRVRLIPPYSLRWG